MSGSENDVVFARLKSLHDTVKNLKPGKGDATVMAIVQEALGFLAACSATDVVSAAIKVLEDGIVLSPQAGTILRLEGGLKQVVRHLRAAPGVAAIVGPCARILAVAAATSTVTQQALAKEKGLGPVLLNACCLHVHDAAIAGPLCEAMAHISRAPKGAVQLECDAALPVLQELLVSYLGNWPVFGWVLKVMKNLAKYEYMQYGGGSVYGTWAAGGGAPAMQRQQPSLASPLAPAPSTSSSPPPFPAPSASFPAAAANGAPLGATGGAAASLAQGPGWPSAGLGPGFGPGAAGGGGTSLMGRITGTEAAAAAAASLGTNVASAAAAASGAAGCASSAAPLDPARGGTGVLSATGEGVRLLLGVARVLARIPEQKKLLKRCSRTVWLLCPHVLVPLPPLEPLLPLPPKDAPHLAAVMSAGEADPCRHSELFPEEYPWQQRPLPPLPPATNLPLAASLAALLPQQQPQQQYGSSSNGGSSSYTGSGHQGHGHAVQGPYQQQQQWPQLLLPPPVQSRASQPAAPAAPALARPPSAKQLCRALAVSPTPPPAGMGTAAAGGGLAAAAAGPAGASWANGNHSGAVGAGGALGSGSVGEGVVGPMGAGAGAANAGGGGGAAAGGGGMGGGPYAGGGPTLGLMPEPFHGYGNSLDSEMVLHDLHRIVNPRNLVNRIVYLNTGMASNSSSSGSSSSSSNAPPSSSYAYPTYFTPPSMPPPSSSCPPSTQPLLQPPPQPHLHPQQQQQQPINADPNSWPWAHESTLLMPRRRASGSGHGGAVLGAGMGGFGSRSGSGCGSSGLASDPTAAQASCLDPLLLQPLAGGQNPSGSGSSGSRNGSRTGSRSGSRPGSGPQQQQGDAPFHLPSINPDPWSRAHCGSGGTGGGGVAAGPPPPASRGHVPGGAVGAGAGTAGGGGGGGGASAACGAVLPPLPPPPLMFHSAFESGNLRCAAQVGPREYDLFLAPDVNDRSEGGNMCQWFYFAVTVPPEACSGGGGAASVPYYTPPAPRGAATATAASAASGDAAAGAAVAVDGSGGASATSAASTCSNPWQNRPGIKLNIVNLRKKESLFSIGKRPVMCLARPMGPSVGPYPHSCSSAQQVASFPVSSVAGAGAGPAAAAAARGRPPTAAAPVVEPGCWFRTGSHISYYPSPYRGRPTVAGEGAATRRGKKPSAAVLAANAAAAPGGGAGAGANASAAAGPATQTSGGGKKLKSKASKAAAAAAAAAAEAAAAAAAAAAGDGDAATTAGGAASTQAGVGPGLYCVTFTVHFPVPGTYYIASCYPYTYTDLQEHLDGLQRRLAWECSGGAAGSGYGSASWLRHQQQQQSSAPWPTLGGPPGLSSSSSSLASASCAPASLPASATPSTSGASTSSSASSHAATAAAAAAMLASSSLSPPSASMLLQQQQQLAGSSLGNNGNGSGCANGPPPLVRSLLCYSLGGLRCELVTITDWSSPLEAVRQRECIFITARVHAGETCASWVMQGILDFLVSSDPAAATLRSSFVFKLVPMLNPDGVVAGNYRCNLAGVDLNRLWDRPARQLHPTVYHSKRLLQQLAAAGRLALYIDLHGHSTKQDTFFYGCEPTTTILQAHGGGGGGGTATAAARTSTSTSASLPQQQQQGAAYSKAAAAEGGAAAADGAGGGSAGAPSASSALPAMAAENGCGGNSGNLFTGGLGVQGVGYGLLQQQQQQPSNGGAGGGASGNASTGGGGPAGGPAGVPLAPPPGPNPRVAARLRVRMLPYLTARISSDFSFAKCNFKIRKAKLSAARVVVHRELGVAGSYTLEASLAGSSSSGLHFGARDYLAMGHSLCRAICELAEVDDTALLEEMNGRLVLGPV